MAIADRLALVRREVGQAFTTKAVPVIAPEGVNTAAGWGSSPLLGGGFEPRHLSRLVNAYGGTDESISWVFACASLIAATGAAYDYRCVDLQSRDAKDPPPELRDLLSEPNEEMTYFDWMEDVYLDLELVGNSYWLKDQMNGFGQPLDLYRLVPSMMRVVTDKQGRKIGYVYYVKGLEVPFKADEIVHYRYRNPLNPYYGMGTVEALIRVIEGDLAVTSHVTGFFENGAQISGILTTTETLGEAQFQRLQMQFVRSTNDPAFRTLIAEKAASYTPLSALPGTLGTVDLRHVAKDEILSGFGVPAPLLGGLMENANYKLEESQDIFYRTMQPKTRRVEERTQADLTRRWDLGFDVLAATNDPASAKIGRARQMFGIGASLNQILVEAGLPEMKDKMADEPLLPSGITLWSQVKNPPKPPPPPPALGPDGKPLVGPDGQPVKPTDGTQPKPTDGAGAGTGGNQQGTNSGADGGGQDQGGQGPAQSGGQGPKATGAKALDVMVQLEIPVLPDGFEKLSDVKVPADEADRAQQVLHAQAQFARHAVGVLEDGFRLFFSAQRKRVLDLLSEFGTRREQNLAVRYSASKAKPRFRDVKAMKPGDVFGPEENAFLRERFAALIDQLGPELMAGLNQVTEGLPLFWGVENTYTARARNALLERVTRINETTAKDIAAQIEEGIKRSYSVAQIASGVPDEAYKGIMGVFDEANASRAATIARTETALMFNQASLAAYQAGGQKRVRVFDGVKFDEPCRKAAGAIWTVEQALADPLGHPNCVRSFSPVPIMGGAPTTTELGYALDPQNPLEWVDPPAPIGKAGAKAGGFTSFGATNTSLGDSAEEAILQLGFKRALEEGIRQGPIDVTWGEYAIELKARSVTSSAYKVGMKAAERMRKEAAAEAMGLKPGTVMAIFDPATGKYMFYFREGISSSELSANTWVYIGTAPA